jgi:hypothetical protein
MSQHGAALDVERRNDHSGFARGAEDEFCVGGAVIDIRPFPLVPRRAVDPMRFGRGIGRGCDLNLG